MKIKTVKSKDSLEYHYRVESDYAKQILLSPNNSSVRDKLFQDGYNDITKIFDAYNPGGGETDYSDLVVSLILKILKKGSSVFDLGCASGNLLYKLALIGYDIEGIDVSDTLIEKAKYKLQSISKSHTVSRADIMSYSPVRAFDCLVMDNVIEHFHPDTLEDILQKCFTMIKKYGYIIILTPHKYSGPHDISKHFIPLGSKAMGFHLQEFSFTDLFNHLKIAGFQSVLGFPVHPRLFYKFNIVPGCSEWAGRKAMYLEKLFQNSKFSRLLKINSVFSSIIVAFLFPAVCVGKKQVKIKKTDKIRKWQRMPD